MSRRAMPDAMARTSTRGALSQPTMLFLVFVGLGLATLPFRQAERLALLWAAMLILGLIYRAGNEVEWDFSLANAGRGAALGLVISLPVLAFLSGQLRTFNERLYGTSDIVLLYYQVCCVSAPVEEFFFRGIIQPRRGASVTLGFYAATSLLLYVPRNPLLVGVLVFVALGVLGIVYGFVRERYGLSASVACHVVVGLVLQVFPSLLESLRVMLA